MIVSSPLPLFPVAHIVRVQNPPRTGDQVSPPTASTVDLRPLAGQPDDADEKIYTRATPARSTAEEVKSAIKVAIRTVEVSIAQLASMPDQTIGQEAQLEKLARESALEQFPEFEARLASNVASYNHTLKYLRLEADPEKAIRLERRLEHDKSQIDLTVRDFSGAFDMNGALVNKRDDGTYVVGDYEASYKGTILRESGKDA